MLFSSFIVIISNQLRSGYMEVVFKKIIYARNFYERVEKHGIDISYLDTNSKEETENYLRIINRLKNLNLPDPADFIYSKLEKEEIISILNDILNKIFDNRLSKKINKISNKVKFEHHEDNTYGHTIAKESILGTRLKKILVSDNLYNIEIVVLAHEYMHALLFKYIPYKYNEVIGNYHYKELLSMLMEYIVVYELSNYFKNDNLEYKHSIERITPIKKDLMEPVATNDLYSLDPVREHTQHLIYSYRISDIYSTKLFEIYKNDKSLINKVYEIIKGRISNRDLLKYYNVKLDEDTTNTYINKLDNICKI